MCRVANDDCVLDELGYLPFAQSVSQLVFHLPIDNTGKSHIAQGSDYGGTVNLDSNDTSVTGRWLLVELPVRADGLPNRAGYTVTTIAAHAIVERIGLKAAVALDGDKLRQALASELTETAAGKLVVSADQLCTS